MQLLALWLVEYEVLLSKGDTSLRVFRHNAGSPSETCAFSGMYEPFINGGIALCLSLVVWTTFGDGVEGKPATLKKAALIQVENPKSNVQAAYVLPLTRANANVNSRSHLRSLRKRTELASLNSALNGQIYLADIQVGTATFKAAIDTGSSDTWLIGTAFQCVNLTTGVDEPQRNCAFGPTYEPSPTFEQIQDQNFNVTYGGGEFLTGIVGRDEVTFAGVIIKDQEIAVVNSAAWHGDGVSSGLVGLAFPAMTRAYAGSDPSKDVTQIVYNPLFTNIYTQGGTPPLFSLAIERSSEPSQGGQLAIGGLPPGYNGTVFSRAPLQAATTDEFQNSGGSKSYESYAIIVNGFTCVGSGDTAESPSRLPSQASSAMNTSQARAIIDSGTTFISLPNAIADEVNALFDPPAIFSTDRNIYLVNCSADPPRFGVNIASEIFIVDSEDLILETGAGDCMSGINNVESGQAILGDVFLKNVLAVFDIGKSEMRFAARRNP